LCSAAIGSTRYGALWRGDEGTNLDAAGVSKSATLWAAERTVTAVGADNMAWDVPDERDPESGSTLFSHVFLLPQKGIYIIDNLNLEELARDRHWCLPSWPCRSSWRAPQARPCGRWRWCEAGYTCRSMRRSM
jgi:kynurenine formamidase